MLFWYLYGALLLAACLFFVVAFWAYLRARPGTSSPAAIASPDLEATLAALEAQFIVAPERALVEARELVRARNGNRVRLPSPIGARDRGDVFREYISLL